MADSSEPTAKPARRPRAAAATAKPAAKKAAPAKGPVTKAPATPKPAKPLKAAATRKAAASSTAKPKAKAKINGNGNSHVAGRDWRAYADQVQEQVSKTARAAAETGKVKTGEAMHGLAKLIADTAGTVDEKMGPQYGDYARYAAEAVAGAARTFDSKELEDLAGEARDFVRKSPAVAIGAAAVLGFVVMRLAKGSEKA